MSPADSYPLRYCAWQQDLSRATQLCRVLRWALGLSHVQPAAAAGFIRLSMLKRRHNARTYQMITRATAVAGCQFPIC
jgi:hypothetical protein